MKQSAMLALLIFFTLSNTLQAKPKKPACELQVTPQWKDLDPQHNKRFHNKLIWVGQFVIKKRSKEFMLLSELDLAWKGEKIKNLQASLFRKKPNQELLPVEDQLVCDGHWNTKKQTLKLKFKEKEYLQPRTTLCLVLTVTKDLEPVLRQGHFDILPDNLPRQLKPEVGKNHLRISLAWSDNYKPRKRRLSRRS